MSTLASERAMRSISCESSAMTPLVPINCSVPSCLIYAFLLQSPYPTNQQSALDNPQSTIRNPQNPQSPIRNHQIRSRQSAVRNLLTGFSQKIFEAAAAALVHAGEYRAKAMKRHA